MILSYPPHERGRSERRFGTCKDGCRRSSGSRGSTGWRRANGLLREHCIPEMAGGFAVPAEGKGHDSVLVRPGSGPQLLCADGARGGQRQHGANRRSGVAPRAQPPVRDAGGCRLIWEHLDWAGKRDLCSRTGAIQTPRTPADEGKKQPQHAVEMTSLRPLFTSATTQQRR